jgi:mRNA-degrading endonuclease toxin of MazEF toxin-antitoxin module
LFNAIQCHIDSILPPAQEGKRLRGTKPNSAGDWHRRVALPRHGEVYLVRLDKDRPALVISANALNRYALDVCVIPMTTVEHAKFSLRVEVKPDEAGLSRSSWAKCDRVATLEKNLLLYPPLGRLTDETLKTIEQGIKLALQLP